MEHITNTLTIDFETYYDRDFSLSNLSTPEYILSPVFEVVGVAVSVNGAPAESYSGPHSMTQHWLSKFDWQNSILVAHNAPFDAAVLSWIFDIEPAKYFCTSMAAGPYITPFTGRSSLATCVQHLGLGEKGTEVVAAKGIRRIDFSNAQLTEYMGYCRNDVDLCYKLYEYYTDTMDMPKSEQEQIHLTVKKFVEPQLEGMAGYYRLALEAHRAEKNEIIKQSGHNRTALGSNARFAALLKEQGVMPPMKKSMTTGKDTYAFAKTDPDFMRIMYGSGDTVRKLCEARLAVKSTQMETRLERFANICDITGGLFPASIWYWAARTGRFGGTDKTNLQNMRRGSPLRKGIVAPEGKKIIAADYSQIEARITATLAEQWNLVEQFANGEDIYSRFAETVYALPEGTVNKDDYPKERFTGKTAILGLGYGMGPVRFYDAMAQAKNPVSHDFAVKVVKQYRRAFPKIRNLWYQANDLLEGMANGHKVKLGPLTTSKDKLHLPNGMYIHYPELRLEPSTGNYIYRGGHTLYGAKLIENAVQALARIVMTAAELKLAARGLYAALTVHDELVYVVEEKNIEPVTRALQIVMTTPPAWMPKLPVACEIGYGDNYGECK